MKVEFKKDANTMSYGSVKKGAKIEVSKEDGKAFISSGLAKKTTEKKETE